MAEEPALEGRTESIDKIGEGNKLLSSNVTSMVLDGETISLGLLSRLMKITSSKKTMDMFFYALRRRAFTALVCQNEMEDMAEATFYRCIKKLLQEKFVITVMRVPRGPRRRRGKGGPIPVIYAVLDYDPEDVVKAIKTHKRFKSPKYQEAHKVAQLILDEYINMNVPQPEIKYVLILQVLKSRIKSVQPDLADLVARDLHEQGIKIWR